MSDLSLRYDRNILLFGKEGQEKLRYTKTLIAGVGGLGSALAQHLALLGVAETALVDDEQLDDTNRNRFIGARHDDPVPGSPKVGLAARLIREINPDVAVVPLQTSLVSPEAFEAIKSADWIFGCFDQDGPRAILNEICAAYARSYIDLASDVPEPGIYGGRICLCLGGSGCLRCLGQLDDKDVRRYLSIDEERAGEAAIYGIPSEALGRAGPSVAPINGVVASLAATEFMVAVTGMRPPARLITYYGHLSQVRVSTDQPQPDCYYCKGIRGDPPAADVERFLKMQHLRERRRAKGAVR
jgi:molybdopterin/thiamine biosynthesis adenylyltransferase